MSGIESFIDRVGYTLWKSFSLFSYLLASIGAIWSLVRFGQNLIAFSYSNSGDPKEFAATFAPLILCIALLPLLLSGWLFGWAAKKYRRQSNEHNS